MSDARTYTYRRIGSHEIKADVYPPDVADPPVVLWLHGGGLIFGSRKDLSTVWAEHLNAYLALGFAVVAIDYRLAPEAKLDAIVDDVVFAFDWVRISGPDLFGFDPERIACVGHSAGGYLALQAACTVEPRPKALVSYYGYGDITAPWYTQPSAHYAKEDGVDRGTALATVAEEPISEPTPENQRDRFYVYCRQNGLWPISVTGHDPESEPSWFNQYCPARNIDRRYPPTLLLHGSADTDVPCDESIRMAKALERRSIEHELIVIPGADHAFDVVLADEPRVAASRKHTAEFLRAHVG